MTAEIIKIGICLGQSFSLKISSYFRSQNTKHWKNRKSDVVLRKFCSIDTIQCMIDDGIMGGKNTIKNLQIQINKEISSR